MIATTANTENSVQIPSGAAEAGGVAAIVIGRNEGQRLVNCLTSLMGLADPIIYVDSGSTDDSLAAAKRIGALPVTLDATMPFTAARARNTGLQTLLAQGQNHGLVQFVDGDCEVEAGWIDIARRSLNGDPRLGIVAGRRRERRPEASVYNRLCDAEWDTPIGPAAAVGGDMMARVEALAAISGFRDDMIAGEEPEMCQRLRQSGFVIQRLDAPMTIHDADMHRFGQWWRRTRRAGHAFAEGNWLHGASGEAFWRREVRRPLIWALLIPALILLALLPIGPAALFALLIYPLQVARVARHLGGDREGWVRSAFLLLGKLPEALGIAQYHFRRCIGQKTKLIEYK